IQRTARSPRLWHELRYAVFHAPMRRSVAVAVFVLCAARRHPAEQVRIGVYVLRLNDLNPPTETFSTDVWIWTLSRAASPLHPIQSLRSEEHTSELQSRGHLVCRLLLEKKKDRGSRSSLSPR